MQSTFLKIISLNIEKDRHFDRIIPFLKKQEPDVILLQEVLDKDKAYLEKVIGMKGVYAALRRYEDGSQLEIFTLTRFPILKSYSVYYRGDEANISLVKGNEPEKIARAILVTEIIKDSQPYCLINTHFTWSPDGQPSELQRKDLGVLLQILAKIPQFVLCGDFNAPRGTAIFDAIALKYKDNIPTHIGTTIDKNLHRAGNLKLVVDGIFTTPEYQVDSIEIIDNLSDHCAILATIKKQLKPVDIRI